MRSPAIPLFPREKTHSLTTNPILNAAYDDVMKVLCIAATAFAVPPLIMSLFMPDWYLGEGQNAVEGLGLDGHKVEDGQVESGSEESHEKGEKA